MPKHEDNDDKAFQGLLALLFVAALIVWQATACSDCADRGGTLVRGVFSYQCVQTAGRP